ncbi:hypothetical protein L198_01654 [Cryptococcus wingfieldii CBS 7118]|uniref:Uncharacterized protein n=1 Tax=Cryptococcus wingfieldii CBS 7118 TaxID=1295528 RepID=A0A1E3K2I7_9TREE|nr:hypothetical protein L198_01654 [Cryptococcus wingfieldii CBS 7118]ODO06422.1 hypothetical protein L198_01654 [Cryptococcus wingfieldii CBS 7118]
MRIARLSRTFRPSSPRVSLRLPSCKREQAPHPPLAVLLTKCLLPPLLALILVLTLIPLLLPTINHHGTTFFTIHPTGSSRDTTITYLPSVNETSPGASASARAAIQNAVADVAKSAGEDSEVENAFVQNANMTLQQWLGLEGPSIFAGALQICSQVSPNDSIDCTSSSQAAYHAALLPLSLGDALFALPTSPSTPILLLVSGILSLLATVVFICGLVTWRLPRIPLLAHRGRRPPLQAAPHRPDYPGDTESVRNLVHDDPEDEKKEMIKVKWGSGPHPAFFCLVLAALGVGGGAMLEVRDVGRAWRAWDDVQAAEVGLEFDVGPLTFLLPFLPLCHILVIVVGPAPMLCTLLGSQRPKARVEAPHMTTAQPQISTPTAQPPQPTIRITEPEASVTATNPSEKLRDKHLSFSETPMVQHGRASSRTSWRNTFGVGVAS